jgi:peptide/nickel transport system ATP-binding protein
VLADEPTTALDASVQIEILLLLRKLQRELGMGLIFVTHDLGVAAQIADQVAVMYAGRIVELGSAGEVLLRPRHPYTKGLLASVARDPLRDHDIEAIPGSPPDLRVITQGCSFAPRCKFARPVCATAVPRPRHVAADHVASCVLIEDLPHHDAPAAPLPSFPSPSPSPSSPFPSPASGRGAC